MKDLTNSDNGCNITTMDYVTIKTYKSTRRMLRIISAATGEQMVHVMERLCRNELEKVVVSQAQINLEKVVVSQAQINEPPKLCSNAAERIQ